MGCNVLGMGAAFGPAKAFGWLPVFSSLETLVSGEEEEDDDDDDASSFFVMSRWG